MKEQLLNQAKQIVEKLKEEKATNELNELKKLIDDVLLELADKKIYVYVYDDDVKPGTPSPRGFIAKIDNKGKRIEYLKPFNKEKITPFYKTSFIKKEFEIPAVEGTYYYLQTWEIVGLRGINNSKGDFSVEKVYLTVKNGKLYIAKKDKRNGELIATDEEFDTFIPISKEDYEET